MNIKTLTFLLLSLFASTVHASSFNAPADYSLSESSGNGLAVLSVTENCPSTMSIKIRSADREYENTIAINQSKALRPSPLRFSAPCGRLVVLDLPAGEYELFSYVAFVDSDDLENLVPYPPPENFNLVRKIGNNYKKIIFSSTKIVEPTESFSIPFTIKSGRITYFGGVHFVHHHKESESSVYLGDERRYDIPELNKLYPQFNESLVDFYFKQ